MTFAAQFKNNSSSIQTKLYELKLHVFSPNMFMIIHWFHPSGQKKGVQDLSQRDQDGSKINSAQQSSTYQQ